MAALTSCAGRQSSADGQPANINLAENRDVSSSQPAEVTGLSVTQFSLSMIEPIGSVESAINYAFPSSGANGEPLTIERLFGKNGKWYGIVSEDNAPQTDNANCSIVSFSLKD